MSKWLNKQNIVIFIIDIILSCFLIFTIVLTAYRKNVLEHNCTADTTGVVYNTNNKLDTFYNQTVFVKYTIDDTDYFTAGQYNDHVDLGLTKLHVYYNPSDPAESYAYSPKSVSYMFVILLLLAINVMSFTFIKPNSKNRR